MKRKVGIPAMVVLIAILALGIDLAFWPQALTSALFGVELGATAGNAVSAGAAASAAGAATPAGVATSAGSELLISIALARVAGISLALFVTMILGAWKRTAITRWLYVGVGAVAVVMVVTQWLAILPDAIGLGLTAVTILMVVLGWLALREPKVIAV